jgi:hypothetical protein
VLHIPLVASLGHLSATVIRREDRRRCRPRCCWPRPRWPRSAGAGGGPGPLIRAAWGVRCLPGSGQVVVVPDGAADACTVPGWPGQIVNTVGMLDALDPAERQVLLAHFVAAANPLVRR